MSTDLLLRGGLVIVEGQEVPRSVAIKSGKIEGVYERGLEPTAKQTVDCDGKYVLPGMVDMHVHLRDLKQSYKEDYTSGTMAAAAGGVTTVVDMPNSDPPVLELSVLEDKIDRARTARYVSVGFYVGTPKGAGEFDSTMLTNALGIKVYPHAPLAKGDVFTKKRIRECMKLAAENGRPLLFHPDSSGPKDKPDKLQGYLRVHSCESELESVKQFIEAKRQVGGHLHVCHVSCGSVARYILENRAEGSLTAEVTPHHLLLDGDMFLDRDGIAKMLPPLRSSDDSQTLREMLCGKCAIDCIASDHAPHTTEEKMAPFMEAASGIPGLETTVPLMLTEVFEGRMSWVDYLRTCCSSPARILGLRGKGILAPGYDADVIVVEKGEYVIDGARFHSKAKVTPFNGRQVKAKPVVTIVEGHIVYDHDKFVVGPGTAGRVPIRKTLTVGVTE